MPYSSIFTSLSYSSIKHGHKKYTDSLSVSEDISRINRFHGLSPVLSGQRETGHDSDMNQVLVSTLLEVFKHLKFLALFIEEWRVEEAAKSLVCATQAGRARQKVQQVQGDEHVPSQKLQTTLPALAQSSHG